MLHIYNSLWNCLGTSTIWPEFITCAFINSFCWSGCTKGLWGGAKWVFAEKLISRGLRACLMQGSHVFHHTGGEPHPKHQFPGPLCPRSPRTLSAGVCCRQLARCSWSPGPVRSWECCVLGGCSGRWASLGWAESCPLSAFQAFPSNSSKKLSQSYRQQQCYTTRMPRSLELSGLMRLSKMFAAALTLSPKAPGSWNSLVLGMFLYNFSKYIPPSLP